MRVTHQTSLGLDQRPVLPVHFVVEATRVTQVVSGAVSPPQRGRCRSTVHALASFCKHANTHAHGAQSTRVNYNEIYAHEIVRIVVRSTAVIRAREYTRLNNDAYYPPAEVFGPDDLVRRPSSRRFEREPLKSTPKTRELSFLQTCVYSRTLMVLWARTSTIDFAIRTENGQKAIVDVRAVVSLGTE